MSAHTLLKADEVARRLNVRKGRVYELCRQGIVPHIKVGKQTRFDEGQLEAWIRAGGQALPGGWRREDDEA